jgi:hypothetical protein
MKGVASHVIYYESCPPCACTNDYFPAAALKRSYNPEWIAFSWNGSYFLKWPVNSFHSGLELVFPGKAAVPCHVPYKYGGPHTSTSWINRPKLTNPRKKE